MDNLHDATQGLSEKDAEFVQKSMTNRHYVMVKKSDVGPCFISKGSLIASKNNQATLRGVSSSFSKSMIKGVELDEMLNSKDIGSISM